ncbi:DUF7502 family protein [Candidatus Halobonum tyrrellensis]|uniref:Uncharacterized protein n=1 Tax=Candidatus Halobonum tyrrellensis G22 TaxID=1324957 RepID=V4HMH7_9EURY|nr:hypothetical protein [Candidatus Halobonum tyrrellensis]ESP89134.1 hypothetical protein K933_05508 [Candidatus Halobonum tyrrellensis G22]
MSGEPESPAARDRDEPAGGDTNTNTDADAAPAEDVAGALREIRREAYKVAAVYGAVDAALVALLVTLAVRLFDPAWATGAVPVPGAPTRLPLPILAGVAAGVVAGCTEVALRARRPVVEQFEAANPEVREMLRTARDAVDDGRDSRMARALYRDVLARLRETSSVGLVDLRRLSVTLFVVVVVSVAGIQAAVVDLSLGGADPAAPGTDEAPDYEGLRDGDELLGDAENVSAGDDELEAELGGAGEGDAPPGGSASAYDSGGLPSGDVEGQRAGFAAAERIEDAELIRDYTRQLANGTDQ